MAATAATAAAEAPKPPAAPKVRKPIAEQEQAAAQALATPEAPVLDVRGDSNGDQEVNISDPTFTLQYLFTGGDAPSCAATADSNADGEVNISDPTYTLRYLFLGGPDHPELTGCDL